ncbi:hypothetical protein CEE45_15605 [Candidatus Heimdallarchaeota archaeon B3_Heim]|nr:MAG: hypothetical protein CEE45_15605 [Candidatus Heimdallarchaeota archaeon B3_Heim]
MHTEMKEISYPKLTPVEFIQKLRKETRAHIEKKSMSIFIGDSNLAKFLAKFGGKFDEENATEAVLDQLMTIFYRLTQKPVGSLVPLRDLLDIIETPYPVDKPKANWGGITGHKCHFLHSCSSSSLDLDLFYSRPIFEKHYL